MAWKDAKTARAYYKKWRTEYKAKVGEGVYLEEKKKYYRAHRRVWKDRQLRKDYGITLAAFTAICKSQNGRCAICRKRPVKNQPKTYLVADHNHKTNKFRGVICGTCNRWLAPLESSGWVKKARRYLKNGRKRVS